MMFSEKEKLIIGWLMQGATDQQIVQRTGLSIQAVRTGIKTIIRKLRLHNRTQVAMWALGHSVNGKLVPNWLWTGS